MSTVDALPEEARTRVLYLSHGAGPMPLLGDADHVEMVDVLRKIAGSLPTPAAILLISAHWEAPLPTLTAGEHPALLYDYYDFPEESYAIEYPAPGLPALARAVRNRLGEAGVPATLDAERGFDHGMFVPLKIMFPQANIPCVQLSLVRGLDARTHLRMGAALAGLRCEDIAAMGGFPAAPDTSTGTPSGGGSGERGGLLIIGSGFSFHNMRAFFQPDTAETLAMNAAFQGWLTDTCTDTSLQQPEREERLIHWEQAPHARYCHPREEHLLPLHVCCGAAGRACPEVFSLSILRKQASLMVW